MKMEIIQWQSIPAFRGIDLYDSFVLGWDFENSDLTFRLEASVWPDSAHYAAPVTGEHTCYLSASLRFVNVSQVRGLMTQSSVQATTDPDGSIDYGTIEGLHIRGDHYLIEGDFGRVEFTAADRLLCVNGNQQG